MLFCLLFFILFLFSGYFMRFENSGLIFFNLRKIECSIVDFKLGFVLVWVLFNLEFEIRSFILGSEYKNRSRGLGVLKEEMLI